MDLLEVGRSINDDVATLGSIRKRRMTEVVMCLKGIELIPETLVVERLDAPGKFQLTWKGILVLLLVEEGIEGCGIA